MHWSILWGVAKEWYKKTVNEPTGLQRTVDRLLKENRKLARQVMIYLVLSLLGWCLLIVALMLNYYEVI